MAKKVTKKTLDKLREEKFGTSPFTAKYQEDLEQSGFVDEIMEGVEQVKSWNKIERAGELDKIAKDILIFVIGFIVGVLLSNL